MELFFLCYSAEVSGAAEDLMLMTKENQALTSELAEASYERDGMRRQIQELGEINAGLEHARRAIEIEKDGNTLNFVAHRFVSSFLINKIYIFFRRRICLSICGWRHA